MEQSLTPHKLLSLLGGFPDKPPRDTQVLEVQEYAAYTLRVYRRLSVPLTA